jgi:sugar phosphate permease
MSENPSPAGDKPVPYRWVIVSLAILSYTISMIARFAWPPLVTVVAPELSISMTEAGAFMTSFYIGYVITQIPSGVLADRFGVRWLLTMTLVVQAASTGFLGSISDFQTGFALRVVSGLSGGCVYAACFRAVTRWFSPKERGLAFGLLMSGPSLGLALANIVAPGLESLFGWRGVFRIVGGFSLVSGLVVALLMREDPAGRRAAAPGAGKPPSFIDGLRYVLSNRAILLLCLAGFSYIWVFVGFISWANAYLKQVLKMSLGEAGAIMTAVALFGLVVSPVAGLQAGKRGQGREFLMGASVLLIAGVVLFGHATSPVLLWTWAILTGVAFGIMTPVYSLVVSTRAEPRWAGSAGGVTNCCWQIAGAVVPVVAGWSIDRSGSFSVVWWIIAGGPAVGLLILALLGKQPEAARA